MADSLSVKQGGATILYLTFWLCFVAGLAVALSAQKQIRQGASMWRSPYFPGLLTYQLLVLLPTQGFLAYRVPEWFALYLWPKVAVYRLWLIPIALVGDFLLSGVGYLLGAQAVRKREGKLVAVTIALLIAGATLFVYLSRKRWQIHPSASDNTTASSAEELFLILAVPVLLAGLIFLLALFVVEGKKIERASRKVALPVAHIASSLGTSAVTSPAIRSAISPSEIEQLAAAIPSSSTPDRSGQSASASPPANKD